jgi:predicted nucleic acid-binding protein
VLFPKDAVRYLSAVVVLELLAGAHTPRDQKALKALVTDFRRSGRILVPAASAYEEAGEVLRRLQTEMGYEVSGASSLVNDILIALSARSIGATVITRNRSDFEAIQSIRPFKLILVS